MSTNHYCLLITFLISFLLCVSEIAFGKYKFNHSLLFKKPRYLFWYGFMYGLLSVIVTFFVIESDLKINDYSPKEYPWAVALTIGFTIRSIAKISLYTFVLGDKPVSIGPKLIIGFLEEFILKKLNDDVDDQLVIEIHATAKDIAKDRTLREQNELFDQAMPTGFNQITKASYMKEIEELKKPFDKCRYFADKFGIQRLNLLRRLMQ